MGKLMFLGFLFIASGFMLENISLDSENHDSSQETWSYFKALGIMLLLINSSMSNAVGIGGGPIALTIMIYIMEFQNIRSLGLTQAYILGGSLIATIIKMSYTHPSGSGHLINYDLVAHNGGSLLCGACTGAFIARLIQDWMGLTFLFLLVSIVSYFTMKKGIMLFKEETKKKLNENELLTQPLIQNTKKLNENVSPALILIAITMILFILFNLMKGDQRFHSIIGVELCSWRYFMIIIMYFCLNIIQCIFSGILLIKKHKDLENDSTNIQWNIKSVIILPVVTYFTGLIAGSLGVGGGLILNPLFIAFGLLPEVSTASCNAFVFMSSFSSFLQFYMAGVMSSSDSLIYFSISLIGSAAGIFGIKKLTDYYKRTSILVLTLGMLLGIVGIIIPINLINNIISEISHNTFSFNFNVIC